MLAVSPLVFSLHVEHWAGRNWIHQPLSARSQGWGAPHEVKKADLRWFVCFVLGIVPIPPQQNPSGVRLLLPWLSFWAAADQGSFQNQAHPHMSVGFWGFFFLSQVCGFFWSGTIVLITAQSQGSNYVLNFAALIGVRGRFQPGSIGTGSGRCCDLTVCNKKLL